MATQKFSAQSTVITMTISGLEQEQDIIMIMIIRQKFQETLFRATNGEKMTKSEEAEAMRTGSDDNITAMNGKMMPKKIG